MITFVLVCGVLLRAIPMIGILVLIGYVSCRPTPAEREAATRRAANSAITPAAAMPTRAARRTRVFPSREHSPTGR